MYKIVYIEYVELCYTLWRLGYWMYKIMYIIWKEQNLGTVP